jgi:hypothetical protein
MAAKYDRKQNVLLEALWADILLEKVMFPNKICRQINAFDLSSRSTGQIKSPHIVRTFFIVALAFSLVPLTHFSS